MNDRSGDIIVAFLADLGDRNGVRSLRPLEQ